MAANVDDLKHDVCDFIMEIHKENGAQYPSGSLYELLQGLSMYVEHEHDFKNKLMSRAFHEIQRNALLKELKLYLSMNLLWKNMKKYYGKRHSW